MKCNVPNKKKDCPCYDEHYVGRTDMYIIKFGEYCLMEKNVKICSHRKQCIILEKAYRRAATPCDGIDTRTGFRVRRHQRYSYLFDAWEKEKKGSI